MQDGVAENYTAAMLEPYLDGDGRPTANRGISFVDPEDLEGTCHAPRRRGIPGPRSRARRPRRPGGARRDGGRPRGPTAPSDGRHHLAHIQVVDPADVPRFHELGVAANMQPYWACNDDQMIDLTLPFLKPERAVLQYPFGSLQRAGARLVGGSDWSVSTPNVMAEVEVAVNRISPEDRSAAPFLPGEALTLIDALAAFTNGSAWVNHLDASTGSIEVGKLADLVVLDRDLLGSGSADDRRRPGHLDPRGGCGRSRGRGARTAMTSPFAAELGRLDALGQADLVRRGEVSAIELVDAAIERIEALNPDLNAVVTPLYDDAREVARRPLPAGPLAGVPFLLKDLGAALAGTRQTSGSRAFREHVSGRDTELAARHRRAGLIVVGKTNTPEFGNHSTTEPELFGPTHNPWDLARTPGGSSGGSAAAVASGMVPAAHGNDGAGSIRIPASCCGLFGLKPTRGRNSWAPAGDAMSGLAVEHAADALGPGQRRDPRRDIRPGRRRPIPAPSSSAAVPRRGRGGPGAAPDRMERETADRRPGPPGLRARRARGRRAPRVHGT